MQANHRQLASNQKVLIYHPYDIHLYPRGSCASPFLPNDISFDLLICNILTDFPCGLPGVADPRICTTHPYLLSNP